MKKRFIAISLLSILSTLGITLVSCSSEPTVINGVDGKDGTDGKDGADGKDGTDGVDGEDGSSFLTGEGEPSSTLGNDGDTYLDLSTYDLYTKENGVWTKKGNIKGSDGEDGADGKDGKDGVDGKDGTNGANGTNGENGKDGENGAHYGETFTVTFDANGGSLPSDASNSIEVAWGDCVDLPTPTYAGYNFIGWYTGTSANDSKFTSKDAVFKDLDLIAMYDVIYYTLPDEVELVDSTSAKENYVYGDKVKIKAKESDEKDFDYFINYLGGRNYKTEIEYTFGSSKNYSQIVYRDHATSEDEYKGTYTGSISVNGEDVSITLDYDGYGYYTLNGEKWSLYGYLDNTYTTYYNGLNENLYIEAISSPAFTFESGSFHMNETMDDGNTYSYFEATETNVTNNLTVRLWLDGNEYVEKNDFKYVGSIYGTCAKGDYEGSTLEFILQSSGSGTLYVDDIEETTVTYVSETSNDDGSVTYLFNDKYGDEIEITALSDGTFTVTYGDYKTFTAEYSYKWYGVLTGTDNNESEIKIEFDETGKGTLYVDGYLNSASFYIEYYTPTYIMVYNETEDTEYKLTISGSNIVGKVSEDMTKTTLTFATSYKEECAIAGTYTYSDDEGDYKVIINSDWTGSYYEDDSLTLSFTLEENDDGTYTATDEDEETYKITVTTSGIKARFGDSSISYTKAS